MLTDLLDLVLPGRCAACSRPGRPLCPACARPLLRPQPHAPRPCPPGLPPVAVAAAYGGSVRQALLAYKERGRRDLAGILGVALAGAVRLLLGGGAAGPLLLVPVPSRRALARARGGAHVARLARVAVPVLAGVGVSARVVCWVRVRGSPRDSAGLSAAERAANLADAFVLARGVRRADLPGPVVVVDDLVTTGATAASVSAVLARAGVSPVGVAAVAGTLRHRQTLSR